MFFFLGGPSIPSVTLLKLFAFPQKPLLCSRSFREKSSPLQLLRRVSLFLFVFAADVVKWFFAFTVLPVSPTRAFVGTAILFVRTDLLSEEKMMARKVAHVYGKVALRCDHVFGKSMHLFLSSFWKFDFVVDRVCALLVLIAFLSHCH